MNNWHDSHAAEIKLLAERKAGEKLKELMRGKTGPAPITSHPREVISPYRATLESNKIQQRPGLALAISGGEYSTQFNAIRDPRRDF